MLINIINGYEDKFNCTNIHWLGNDYSKLYGKKCIIVGYEKILKSLNTSSNAQLGDIPLQNLPPTY